VSARLLCPPTDPPPTRDVVRAPLTASVEPLLSVVDLVDVLRTSRRSIERMRSAGRLPGPDLHLGVRQPRWRAETIRAWIEGGCRP
jgi:predicted DNA-binding transcriptional regulator AlpA